MATTDFNKPIGVNVKPYDANKRKTGGTGGTGAATGDANGVMKKKTGLASNQRTMGGADDQASIAGTLASAGEGVGKALLNIPQNLKTMATNDLNRVKAVGQGVGNFITASNKVSSPILDVSIANPLRGAGEALGGKIYDVTNQPSTASVPSNNLSDRTLNITTKPTTPIIQETSTSIPQAPNTPPAGLVNNQAPAKNTDVTRLGNTPLPLIGSSDPTSSATYSNANGQRELRVGDNYIRTTGIGPKGSNPMNITGERTRESTSESLAQLDRTIAQNADAGFQARLAEQAKIVNDRMAASRTNSKADILYNQLQREINRPVVNSVRVNAINKALGDVMGTESDLAKVGATNALAQTKLGQEVGQFDAKQALENQKMLNDRNDAVIKNINYLTEQGATPMEKLRSTAKLGGIDAIDFSTFKLAHAGDKALNTINTQEDLDNFLLSFDYPSDWAANIKRTSGLQ